MSDLQNSLVYSAYVTNIRGGIKKTVCFLVMKGTEWCKLMKYPFTCPSLEFHSLSMCVYVCVCVCVCVCVYMCEAIMLEGMFSRRSFASLACISCVFLLLLLLLFLICVFSTGLCHVCSLAHAIL